MDVETIAYEQAKDREHYRKRRDDSPPPMPTRDYRDYEDDVIINADSALEAAWSLGRSYSQIANRRAKLRRGDTANYGVRGWTAPEIQLLLIPTKSNESIAEQTGRTTVSVSAARRRFRNNGIDVPRRRRNFSHDEDALILSRTLTGQQIADRTGRSRLTIFQRARQLGVSLNFGAPKWTAQEDHIILSEKSNTVVAQLTSRSVKAVQVRRSKLKRLKCDRMLEGMRA
jgi:biotin operon repressor